MTTQKFNEAAPHTMVYGNSAAAVRQGKNYFAYIDGAYVALSDDQAAMTREQFAAEVKKKPLDPNPNKGRVTLPNSAGVTGGIKAAKPVEVSPAGGDDESEAPASADNEALREELQGMHAVVVAKIAAEAGIEPATGKGSKEKNIEQLLALETGE